MNKYLFSAFVFLLLSLFTGVQGLHAETWRIGTWKTAQTIQPFFYEDFSGSARVQVFPFTNPADQRSALLAGSLDMTGTTLVHAIAAASRGEPVVLVAALCNKSSALVVHKNSQVQDVADLKEMSIGYVPGTMHEVLLRETLEQHGVDPERDVNLRRVDFFDMGTALARGDIDAFLSGEPFPSLAVHQGYGRILTYPYFDDSIGHINAGLLVTSKTVKERPELVQSMVNAHMQATEHLTRHKDQWLQAAGDFGTPIEVLQTAADNMELAWDMDETFVRRVQKLGARMQELGMIDEQPDYEKLLNTTFVENARRQNGHE
ncbi:NMT1/THI5 like domain protein [Desulfonatronospira thiodismutans ASO3-1]|uniref:NMT1/THI5 like domain protein n=1 Tax=Desulfonatronospira thiodismutans ASO3-1 TaxID=555779 RepID=D6SPE6_9BACT|nr:NrtA/SsuA/CpmA family ABC transporter substrate-binding protein [Desulfonatronospira thiodismutans]EFI34622.1 NMT1/THI5 like domain protein [Desulfonatronospira thiodismutans ASO3-1]